MRWEGEGTKAETGRTKEELISSNSSRQRLWRLKMFK